MALTAKQVQELKAIVERRRAALVREVGRDLDRCALESHLLPRALDARAAHGHRSLDR